jgi:hypothetical protein
MRKNANLDYEIVLRELRSKNKSSDIDHSASIVYFILFLLLFAFYRFIIGCYIDTEKAKATI